MGERADVNQLSGGTLCPIGVVVFFVPMPRLADVHRDREEPARPCGDASLPASPRAFQVSSLFFSLPLFSYFRVRVPWVGISGLSVSEMI
jgi:hypothetical protein